MLSERDRKQLADIERRLEHDDPGLAQRMSQQSPKGRRWRLLWCLVLSLLLLYAGIVGQDSFLILLALSGFLLAGILAALRFGESRDDDDPGSDGGGWPRCTL
jgi:hypothetical protein